MIKLNNNSKRAEQKQNELKAKLLLDNLAMSRFIDRTRELPVKRQSQERNKDFKEVYNLFSNSMAGNQAARCSQCGIPFCQNACPIHNNIPDWLMLAAAGRWYEAYQHSSATNPFPEICGRICPQDRLCEGECVMEQSNHESITIGSIETYITELAWQEGWVEKAKPNGNTGKSVGIIGSGPAGLSAAIELKLAGIDVEVWEKNDRPGGLLAYGIPNFKLDRKVVERRITFLQQMGIKFTLNCQIGKDLSFPACRAKHDAILIATGVYKNRLSGCKWPDKSGTIAALPYLIASNRMAYGDKLSDEDNNKYHLKGRNVLVIGGGDTAMDCVRTAVRQQAKSVTCIYRRDRDNMPGSKRELNHAEEEGVNFAWKLSPIQYLQSKDGYLTALKAHPMIVARSSTNPDRKNIIMSDQKPVEMACDTAIEALGFIPENLTEQFNLKALNCDNNGHIIINHNSQTSLPNVFAVGDIVRGASLVVWAIRDGMKAGKNICSTLLQKHQNVA